MRFIMMGVVVYIFASIISAQASEREIYGISNTEEHAEIIKVIDLD